jgi:hypothetical protein
VLLLVKFLNPERWCAGQNRREVVNESFIR